MAGQTFKKNERLTNKKTFEFLFEKGNSFSVFPFKIVWAETGTKSTTSAQLGISVPKRLFARAVDRNTLKRRIRESYRKNKQPLYEILKKKNLTIALMVIYIAKEELPYQEIEKKMIVSLLKLIEKV